MRRSSLLACLFAAVAIFAALVSLRTTARNPAYILSLSWSPEYCAERGDGDRQQCGSRPYGFVVHGLWPEGREDRDGCDSRQRVSDETIEHMLPIMPSRGLIIHEWHAHGACTGLAPEDYFAEVEKAYRSIHIPSALERIDDDRSTSPDGLVQDFVNANPRLSAGDIRITCSSHYLREVRICMDASLDPTACSNRDQYSCDGSLVLRPER